LLGTDIYKNGNVIEGFAIQMLNHAMSNGTTIFVAGSGFSSRTPRKVHRTIATAMTHADGILVWCSKYFSKYRMPGAFWNKNGRNKDSRGRRRYTDWRPTIWPIVKDMLGKMKRADAYLGHATSMAKTAVVFSNRTGIAQSNTSSRPYFRSCMGIYSDLIRRHIPVDAVMIETASSKSLSRYHVIIMPDATTLRPKDIKKLKKWVQEGGTLIVNGKTSLC